MIRFGLALRDAGDAALISVLDDLTLDLPSAWEGSLHFLAAPVTSPDSVDTDDINATQEPEKPRFKDIVAFVILPRLGLVISKTKDELKKKSETFHFAFVFQITI